MLTSQFNISSKLYLYTEDAFPDFVEHEERTGGDISTMAGMQILSLAFLHQG
jgi:hypothetical protein